MSLTGKSHIAYGYIMSHMFMGHVVSQIKYDKVTFRHMTFAHMQSYTQAELWVCIYIQVDRRPYPSSTTHI